MGAGPDPVHRPGDRPVEDLLGNFRLKSPTMVVQLLQIGLAWMSGSVCLVCVKYRWYLKVHTQLLLGCKRSKKQNLHKNSS